MLIQDIIDEISETCSVYFPELKLAFNKASFNKYIASGNNISQAIDNRRNDRIQIKVLKWFDDFWVYIELNFIPINKEFPQSFISVSIFQGKAEDDVKTQLFRAEWDNHYDNNIHPQPHWHIYPYKYEMKIYEDFEAFNEMKEEENSFLNDLSNKDEDKFVDIRNFHFAMSAQWYNLGTFIHKIDDGRIIVNWMSGLLKHVREQLEYIR